MQPSFERGTKSENANSGLSKTNAALLAVVYSTVLASLPMDLFQDRANYLDHAEAPFEILVGYAVGGPLTVLFNEPLWFLINAVLSLLLSPEWVVRVIILFSSFIAAYFILSSGYKRYLFLILFLFLPQVMRKYTTHLRQGMAISVFMLGLISGKKSYKLILIYLSSFIHSSLFFVVFVYVIGVVIRRVKFSAELQTTTYTLLGLILAPLSLFVASLVNARQAARYDLGLADVSGLGFVFWFVIVSMFICQGSKYVKKHFLSVGGLIVYLSFYFFFDASARVFSSFIPFILISGLDLSSHKKRFFLFFVFLYGLLQWMLILGGITP